MFNEVTGSMRTECDKRLDTFFRISAADFTRV